jgi:hypothetical protein
LNREFVNSEFVDREFVDREFAGALAPRRSASKPAMSRHSWRRIARSGLRDRRVRRSPSLGVISPRPIAVSTFPIAATISDADRMRAKSMPSRSPGSGRRAGGKTTLSTGRSRYRLRMTRGASVPGRAWRNNSPSGRRHGLRMPRGRPCGLPECPFAKRPFESRGASLRVSLVVSPAASLACAHARDGIGSGPTR